MQTKHIKSLAREVAHILKLFENWYAASKRLPTPGLGYSLVIFFVLLKVFQVLYNFPFSLFVC